MTIDKFLIDQYLPDLKKCVEEANDAVMEIYKSGNFDKSDKKDGSPLTIADKRSNEIIINNLKLLTPNLKIISEETFEPSLLKSIDSTYWLVDPLDGTKEFINKTDEFTVNIALIHNRKPIFGIVGAPVSKKVWHGSIFNTVSIENTKNTKLRVVMSKSHRSQEDKLFLEFLDRNKIEYSLVNKGSSLKLCCLCDDAADIYPRFGPTSEWDIAAAHAVLLSKGGSIIGTPDFNELSYSKTDTILNSSFIGFKNEATKNEFLPLLRDFFKKLV